MHQATAGETNFRRRKPYEGRIETTRSSISANCGRDYRLNLAHPLTRRTRTEMSPAELHDKTQKEKSLEIIGV
jgi:hypothetical protein